MKMRYNSLALLFQFKVSDGKKKNQSDKNWLELYLVEDI